MSKTDNYKFVLMTHRRVKLVCDNEILRLEYHNSGWYLNGENTGLQVTGLLKMLKEKYTDIKVIWKKQA